MLLGTPVKEVLNLKNFYQCNLICHECKAHKDTYMVPTLETERYSWDEFWTDCLKPGPICFLDWYAPMAPSKLVILLAFVGL